MKLILSLLSFSFVLILSGCEYQINKTDFHLVKQDVAQPDLQVSINLNSDTVYIYRNPNIVLTVKLSNKTLRSVKFYVNEIERTDASHSNTGEYYISVDVTKGNIFKLRAEVYTSTETGSISDIMGSESFIYKTKTWTLIYDPDLPVLKSEIVDGRLKLSWTPIRNNPKGRFQITNWDRSDTTTNSWYIDSSYIGGPKSYYITFNDLSGYEIMGEVNYPYWPALYVDKSKYFTLYWDKCQFYNNIKYYKVQFTYNTVAEVAPSDSFYVFKNLVKGTLYQITFYVTNKESRLSPSIDKYVAWKNETYLKEENSSANLNEISK